MKANQATSIISRVNVFRKIGSLFTGIGLFIFSSFILTLISTNKTALAETKYSFKKAQIVTVSKNVFCGLIKNSWTSVRKSGKRYVIYKRNQSRCKNLLKPTSLRKSGLVSIPSAADLLKERTKRTASAVSGTPPILKNIPSLGSKNLFWRSGFIDELLNTPFVTPEQCREFFAGATDGESAGMLGCYAVQGVGYSFQSILEGGSSVCFMKGIPTEENLKEGGVTIVEGSLPNNDITQLFATPEGSEDRLIKVVLPSFGGPTGDSDQGGSGGEIGFINVHSTKKLASKGNQYGYNLWFCKNGEINPNNYEETSVSLAGEFKALNVNIMNDHKFRNELAASLTTVNGSVTFDLTKSRVAKSTGEFGDGSFKSLVTLLPDNTITTKVKESFNGFGRSNYGIASFTGSGLNDFTVRAAALKDVFGSQSMSAGLEFRDSIYLSSPNNELTPSLDAVDIATDKFYEQDDLVTPDYSGKSCTATPSVTISMNFSSPRLQNVFKSCNSQRLENMDFCRSQDIFLIQSKCSNGPRN